MDRNGLRNKIRKQVDCRLFLGEEKGRYTYICPFCGSGTRTGTPALRYYENTNLCCCFAEGKTYDVLDLIQNQYGVGYSEALEIGARYVENGTKKIENPYNTGKTDTQDDRGSGSENSKDYGYMYHTCQGKLKIEDRPRQYLHGRGIRTQTALNLGVGYDGYYDRLIFPLTKNSYRSRLLEPVPGKDPWMMNYGGKVGIFNEQALYKVGWCWVVEGGFDVLSFAEIGRNAVSISASSTGVLLRALEENRPTAHLILAMDNDEAGKRAQEILKNGLKCLQIRFDSAEIYDNYKDANEYLVNDREGFTEKVSRAERVVEGRTGKEW